ncbi:VOC family protein [Variovorax paradoxus]|uniref:VOC family protein n=1 Tax=Variovorax paradoxus TaxID=34073 RepID=UPI001933A45C|nr:VOC family protein [Variovorax paradoxus]
MELKFSHVDIVVKDLKRAIEYCRQVLGCKCSDLRVWNRDGFHVEYVVMFNGEERFMLVQPFEGVLKDLLDEKGEGTIYRLCYTVPDIYAAFAELKAAGVQPENEQGQALQVEDLSAATGKPIIWLPKALGSLSIELLDRAYMEPRMEQARLGAN